MTNEPGVVLHIRAVGEFYEAWGADAAVLASALELTLTSRVVEGVRVPMSGFLLPSLSRHTGRAARQGIRLVVD